ncbi:hypothetical protein ACGF3J_17635 [Streptomyces sp. NPDC048171]|uniref:hypothetical protein n=1 Tax=Streptomyces sp. NPDC048171 TaxID=3365504 RepID=UPI0037152BFD
MPGRRDRTGAPSTDRRRALARPAAAVGLVVLQLGATGAHLRLGDREAALDRTLLATATVTVRLATTWL